MAVHAVDQVPVITLLPPSDGVGNLEVLSHPCVIKNYDDEILTVN